jgi:NAD(P)-dependent dehydrogenase (short-subunit alcohol dehydrogenase family)
MGSMDGKICIVTGGNSGIGKETARGLAQEGATVVIACRDVAKGEEARSDVAASTGAGERVKVMALDLASFASIRAFAQAFAKTHGKLHVLVNNAGLSPNEKKQTADGLELTFGVNHVGPHLLTKELVPLLEASAPARVVFLSSSIQKGAKLDLDDPMFDKRGFSWMDAYGASKLANVFDTLSWAEKLSGAKVTVNAVHPGVVKTGLARDVWWLNLMAKLFFISPQKGARSSLFAAMDPSLDGTTGKYFEGTSEKPVNAVANDPAAREKLWALTEKLIAERSAAAA